MAKERARNQNPRSDIENAPTLGEALAEQAVAMAGTLDGGQPPSDRDPAEAPAQITVRGRGEPADPTRIGRYVVLRLLGQGGMGTVYSAYDADLDRKVAVKVVRDSVQHSGMVRARVLKEAQAMARIAHPNVVSVYEVGQETAAENGRVFIAMEFVAGVSLSEWQRQHGDSASVDELVQTYLQAAAGLEAAHRCGLIHRDFKPDNVLVGDDGRVRVADFGLARALDVKEALAEPRKSDDAQHSSGERLTQAGMILGTPGYMSPEQVTGDEADARSDQFAFCAALYQALYRQLPFAGETFEEFASNVSAGKLRTPPTGSGTLDVPIALDQVLRRGLSRDPAQRFPSMQALSAALVAALHPDSDSQRSNRRKWWVRASVVILIALLIVRHKLKQQGVEDLRGNVRLIWSMLPIFPILLLALPKLLRRQPAFRKLMVFSIILYLYVAISRSFALIAGMSKDQSHMMECLGLTAIVVLEFRSVRKRYLWPAALFFICAVLVLVLPQRLSFIQSELFNVTIIVSAYLAPWDSVTAAKIWSRDKARSS